MIYIIINKLNMDKLSFYNDTVNLNELWFQSHRDLLEKIAVELNATDKVDFLSEKFLGDKLKMKKMSDPSKPKKAKTSFIYFCNEERPKIIKGHTKMKLGDVMKELGSRWSSLEDKSKYVNLHTKDKERYNDEMDAYNHK